MAKKIAGGSYRNRSILLSGLIATLGSIIGGIGGGLVSGIGSATIPLAGRYYDKKSVEPWADYFIDIEKK